MKYKVENIQFISCQPEVPYFHWQVETYLENFISLGVNPKNIHILFAIDRGCSISEQGKQLAKKYPNVNIYFYESIIQNSYNKGYIPILRPNILAQHFERFSYLNELPIFYHDSDIIFRELPDFSKFMNDDIWYLSDTNSYICARYINEKSEQHLDKISEIVGIDKKIAWDNNENSGGAQYLMKNINAEYWKKMEKNCLEMYQYFAEIENYERSILNKIIPSINNNIFDNFMNNEYYKLHTEGKRIADNVKRIFDNNALDKLRKESDIKSVINSYNPIQKWCSDMWSVIWNAWYFGHETKVDKELDFCWATDNINRYYETKIFHNAGVTGDRKELFYKGEFINKSPFNEDLNYVSDKFASFKYVEAINKAKKLYNYVT